jgi:hypothetical protein
MTETERLLYRQAEWQRERQNLSWPEKIRQAEQLRATVEAFRARRLHRSTAVQALDERPQESAAPQTQ